MATSISDLELGSLTGDSIARNQAAVIAGFRVASTDPPPRWELEFSFTPGISLPVRMIVPTHIGTTTTMKQSSQSRPKPVSVRYEQ